MTAWWSLTKKELRLGQPAFLMALIAFIVVLGIASYFGYREGLIWEVVTVISALALGGHLFYLAFYLLYSLQAERNKLHLWLHNPLPGYALLLSKITAGLFSLAVSMLFSGAVFLVALNLIEVDAPLPWPQIINIAIFIIIHILLLSISFAIWFLFFWMIFLLLNRSLNSFISFLVTFVIFATFTSLYGWFGGSGVYEALTFWGEFNLLNMAHGLQFTTDFALDSAELTAEMGEIKLYLGTYVFETIVTVLLFLAASWMLDRKVEV